MEIIKVRVCVCCQVHTDISVDSKHQTVGGISFPLSPEALAQLHALKDGRISYVQLVLLLCSI